MFGQEILVGNYILYPAGGNQLAKMSVGLVLDLTERDSAYVGGSRSKLPQLKVRAFTVYGRAPCSKPRVLRLDCVESVVVIEPYMLSRDWLGLLNNEKSIVRSIS